MKVDIFFQNFELLTDAPNAVVKLREIILQLAVQGKLVRQDPNDEPASILLKRIRVEKEKLVKSKVIRREDLISPVNPKDELYKLPESWIWCRWNDVSLCIGDVDHKMPPEVKEGIPYVSPRDFIEKNDIDFERAKKISSEDFENLRKKIQPSKGDIIFPRYGTIGENRLVETNLNFLASYSCAVVKSFHGFIEPKYCFYYSLSNLVKTEIAKYTNKTTQANVGVKSIKLFIFPLPPLAEQKHIVEKCDRLLSICDEIEKRQQQRQESIVRMNESAIAQLLSSQNPDEFRQHWQRICNNFDLLYSVPETIPKLRQAILQLAVQGKLVRQDPNDEPASVLFEKIKSEKEELVKQKKLKKPEQLLPISSNDLSYEAPEGWEWVRLDSICYQITDGTHHTPKYTDSGVPFLSVKDVSRGKINLSDTRYISREEHEELIKRCHPEFEDVLLTKVGTTGIAKVIDIEAEFSIFVSLALLKFSKKLLFPYYLELALNSPLMKNQSERDTQGVGNKNLVLKYIKNFIFPLPPLAEQKRIVEKCDRLMSLCDTLEAKLKQGRDSSEKLMEVAAKQVLTA